MLMDSDGTGYSVTSADDAESTYGEDHTFGTGNSVAEDPLQPIDDLAEATDGDDNDGGFADPTDYFAGLSDPDGDGEQEETLLGHEADLPDEDPTPDGGGDSTTGDSSSSDGGGEESDEPVQIDLSGLQGLGGSSGGSSGGSGGGSGGMSPVLLVGAAAVVVGAAVYVGGR